MANLSDRWYFSKEKIKSSPSVKDGIEHSKELGYRQQCANYVQDIGQRLQVNQLVINTAIVYMHRFYMYHSFKKFQRFDMAPCFVFLAAKIEEMPRKLEHVLKAAHACLKKEPPLDVKSDEYMRQSEQLVNNESILLQTLGFEVTVEHPNTFVVKCAQLVKASKELAQTAYFLATNSLHLTTFCIEYRPTAVACVCIYVACLWANYIIPESDEKNWYECIEPTCTKKLLDDLSSHFITILDSSPTRLKRKLTSGGAVVYKEGKVVQKNSSSTSSNNNKTESNSSSSNQSSSSSKAISKTHLTGMLKPQSHESTPPPSSHRTSHSSENSHRQHKDNSKNDQNQKIKDAKAHQKAQEKAHMEHKRKTLTPEQFEEYKKRKEKEKQEYYRKKMEAMQKDKAVNGNSNTKTPNTKTPNEQHKSQSQKLNSQYKGSPAKRQKLDNDSKDGKSNVQDTPTRKTNHDRLPTGFTMKHRPGLSSSGSDSDTHSNRNHSNHKNKNFSPINQSKTKSNDHHHMSQPPGVSNRSSFPNLPPPPPPSVATKYS